MKLKGDKQHKMSLITIVIFIIYVITMTVGMLAVKVALNEHGLGTQSGLIGKIIIGMSVMTVLILLLLAVSLLRFKQSTGVKQMQMETHDRITELPNRKFLLQFYEKISSREREYVYVLFHVNFFKRINSLFGYEVGSNLLKDIGVLLKESVNEGECAARASTDFFGLILKNAPEDVLEKRIQELFEKLSQINIKDNYNVFDYKCYYTGGISVLDDKKATLEEMNNRSYKVIFDLGELEQNQWAFYDEKRKEEQQLENELAGDIIRALQEKEFIPYFQPQYNIETKEVTGAEVLARWNHPQKGILMPNRFLPLLEDAGCILELDIIMLEEACRQIKAWMNDGLLPVPLSLNFSMLNLHRKDFVNRVEKILDKYDVNTGLISLEFKKTELFSDMDKAKIVFNELRTAGFKLAIDGFGTGDSSFRIMEEMEVRTIKLDRSLISRIADSKNSRVIVRHIIKMASELNFIVIAEGVEEEEQLEMLEFCGCEYAQGYLFGKPCSIHEFEKLIFEI